VKDIRKVQGTRRSTNSKLNKDQEGFKSLSGDMLLLNKLGTKKGK